MSEQVTLPRAAIDQMLAAMMEVVEWDKIGAFPRAHESVAAMRKALEQPRVKQEPVAWIENIGGGIGYNPYHDAARKLPDGVRFDLYVHQQNLRCKSEQARLATLWGYEKAGQPKEIVAYEYAERRPYGAPGEIRRGTILLEHYRNADGTIAGDWEWLIQQFKNATKTTISLRPLYPGPYIIEQEKKNG